MPAASNLSGVKPTLQLPAWRMALEPLLLALAVPLLLFPRGQLPYLGLALLLAAWPLRRLAAGGWALGTGLTRPALVLALMAPAALYPSVDLALSLPKLYGLVLGLAVAFAALAWARGPRRFWLAIGGLPLATVGVALLGLVSTEWSGKLPPLLPLYAQIPRLFREVQASGGTVAGVNPNELGGTLAFLLPLTLALLLRPPRAWPARLGLLLVAAVGLAVLGLTASRSAYLALTAVALGLGLWRWRRLGLALLALALAAGVAAALWLPEGALDLWLELDAPGLADGARSLASRVEIWQRALLLIADFPFTGIGLNTFDVAPGAFYPLPGPAANVKLVHAHNIFLQTALDLGLGGLAGFLGLCGAAFAAGRRAYRRLGASGAPPNPAQAAVVGLLAGLAGYLVFGLADAVALGAKPTVLLWLMFGLVFAAERLGDEGTTSTTAEDAESAEVRNKVGFPRFSATSALSAVNESPTLPIRSLWLQVLAEAYWLLTYALVALAYAVVALGVY